jgi:hypothetical protein
MAGGVTGTGGSLSAAGTGGGAAGGASSADRLTQVCQRWSADRADLSEGTWTGSTASCDAGDIGAPGRANALKLINLYRFLVGLPEVVTDPAMDAMAQQCALMQSANGSLSHTPPTTWSCYTADGATAAAGSNISGGPGVMSIDLYMTDGGVNAGTMGHRRWVLANSLGPIGLGSATSSCFYNTAGSGRATNPFSPWPPAGPVPLDALTVTNVDTAGWTLQSDTVNVNAGTVTVTDAGQVLPVTSAALPGGYGSRYAIRFVPSGWQTQAGHSYTVTLSGTSSPVTYTVEVVSCS